MQAQLDLHGFQSNLLHRNRPTFGNLAVHMAFSTRLSRAASSRADGGCAANGSDAPSGHADHQPEQGPDRPVICGDSNPRRTGRGRPIDSSGGTLNYEAAHWHSPVDGRGGRQRSRGHRRRSGGAFPSESRGKRACAPSGDVALADFCTRLRQAGKVESIGETAWRMSDALPRDQRGGANRRYPAFIPCRRAGRGHGGAGTRHPRGASALPNTSVGVGLTVSRGRSLSAAT